MAGLRVNTGAGFDGSTVTTTLGKTELKLIKASYGETLDKGVLSYMGSQTQDEITPGNYKTDDLKMTMSSVIFRGIFLPRLPTQGFGNVALPFVISRAHPSIGSDSDLLLGCYCKNLAAAIENSNKAEEVELAWQITQIKWTNARKTINALKGAVPVGAVAL